MIRRFVPAILLLALLLASTAATATAEPQDETNARLEAEIATLTEQVHVLTDALSLKADTGRVDMLEQNADCLRVAAVQTTPLGLRWAPLGEHRADQNRAWRWIALITPNCVDGDPRIARIHR